MFSVSAGLFLFCKQAHPYRFSKTTPHPPRLCPGTFVLLRLAGCLSAISRRTHPSSFSACLQLSLLFCLLPAIIQLKREVHLRQRDAHSRDCRPSQEEPNTGAIRRAAPLLCREAGRRDSDVRARVSQTRACLPPEPGKFQLGGSLSAASTGSRPSHARRQFPWRPISPPAAAAGTAENKAEPR